MPSGTTLLERDGLLAAMEARLAAAGSGDGTLLLVAGEAGSGKTSLVAALVSRIGRDALVLQGACDPLSTPRPLGPLLDIASDPGAGLAGLFDTSDDPVATFGVVLDRLRSSIRPVLMVLEDLHWADEATLDLLRFVGRRVGSTKALVVVTYRDDEVGPDHPLRTVLGQLVGLESTHRMVVPALTEAAVATLAAGRSTDPRRLHQTTGGNAFFVTEVLAAGETLPATVQEAVLARVGRLRGTPRRVVEAVSIAPRALEIGRVFRLVGADAAAVDEAIGAGVVLGSGTLLRFRHELARAAVEESLPPARRFELHRRMLSILLEDDSPDSARLSHHAVRAGAAELVVEHAPRAARDASRRGSHKEAAAFYEAALGHQDLLGEKDAAQLRLELSFELSVVDRQDDAMRQTALAVEYFRATDQAHPLAAALGRLASSQWRQHDISGARRSIDEAIELLRPFGPSRHLANTLFESGYYHMLARHRDPAVAAIAESLRMADETGSADVAVNALLMEGTIEIVLGDPRRGVDLLGAAKVEADRRGDTYVAMVALGMLGSGGGEARLYPEAIEALEEGIALGVATDQDYSVSYDRAWLARIAFEQGHWDAATRHAEGVIATTPNESGIAMVTALGALGRVGVRRGDPLGRDMLERVLPVAHVHEIQHVWSPLAGLAEDRWLTGQNEAMADIVADGYRRALDTDSPWARGELGFWMWRAGAIEGPPAGAAAPFALQMSGQWRAAAETWREIGCPYEVGLALSDGDATAMMEALAIFDSLGARPAAAMTRARLRDHGATGIPRGPTAVTRSNPAGLTARQLEVLDLVSAGMSNAEIADRLFLSPKTVAHHVSAICTKLEVPTRTKAAAEARRLGIVTD